MNNSEHKIENNDRKMVVIEEVLLEKVSGGEWVDTCMSTDNNQCVDTCGYESTYVKDRWVF